MLIVQIYLYQLSLGCFSQIIGTSPPKTVSPSPHRPLFSKGESFLSCILVWLYGRYMPSLEKAAKFKAGQIEATGQCVRNKVCIADFFGIGY